jgi:hypothetical protein
MCQGNGSSYSKKFGDYEYVPLNRLAKHCGNSFIFNFFSNSSLLSSVMVYIVIDGLMNIKSKDAIIMIA